MSEKGVKRKVWSEDDVHKLIEVWQSSINELRLAKRNSFVYKKMSLQLCSVGVNATHVEIRIKINNLTQKYRDEKKKFGPTGGSPSQWKLYKKVHEVIGCFVSNDVKNIHESIAIEFMDSKSEDSNRSEAIEVDSSSSTECSSECPLLTDASNSSSSTPTDSSIAETSAVRAKKRKGISVKQQILEEMKRTNKLIEEDAKECKKILKDSESRDNLWFQMTKDYFDKSLDLQKQIINANVKK